MLRDCRKFTGAPLLRRIRAPPMYCLFAREQLRMKIHKSALAALIVTLYCGAAAGHSFAAGSPAASSTANAGTACERRGSRTRRPGRSYRGGHAARFALAQLYRLSRQREKILRRRRLLAGVDPEWQGQPSGRLDDPALSAGCVEGPQPRGLRRLAMGRATGQAATYSAEAIRHRPCAYRSGADGLRDALHFRPAYRKGESSALQVRPDGRTEKI